MYLYTEPPKNERIIRSNYMAMYSPLMNLGWAFSLWDMAFVSLESIGMFSLLRMEEHSHYS